MGRPLLILTRQEVEARRQRTLDLIHIMEHHGLQESQGYADLMDRLDDCDFLLGDR